jgi:hypothetical protein
MASFAAPASSFDIRCGIAFDGADNVLPISRSVSPKAVGITSLPSTLWPDYQKIIRRIPGGDEFDLIPSILK